MSNKFNSTFEYKLIYVFRINDGIHGGCLKVGDATIYTDKNYTELSPFCHELNFAARERIDSYTSIAGIKYELLYTEIAIQDINGKIKAFRDYKVHGVLKRSGIKVKYFDTNKKQNEWFITDLNTVKNAIKAVKKGESALNSSLISKNMNPIVFRPEQEEAIKKTISRFKKDTKMLWNAKMRFGKTLTALQVVKEMNFTKTIIITHRPVVSEGWFEDFNKIFYDRKEYFFSSKNKGKSIKELLKSNDNFVYFASMQDLRGSDIVGGSFEKNNEIFNINWDFVVVDEAHEGTKTDLGKNVLNSIIKEKKDHKTYVLELSGTPFNLLTDFESESIYTWDYIMEQEAKTTWDKLHFGDSNPYEELPKMNIYTYHLEKSLPVYIDVMDKAFNFREFFRLWTGDIKKDGKSMPKDVRKDNFIHESDIIAFLDLICKKDENTNYPFSTSDYRNYFRHSLWVVPGVKEAKALSLLLKKHHIFKNFNIINVAGDGDEEIDTKDALNAVRKGMSNNPENTYTITLSCGRLTTGVSVPEWTAVLMLAGSYSTAASQYLQTIFRVQTPANINGKIKQECYVFDFAPDRTLKMVAESVQLSARAGANNSVAEIALGKFLNYCPVISISDSNMKEYKVSELLQELKKAYAERVVRNGFDDPKIYNDELLKLSEVELKEFDKLKKIVGDSKQTKKTGNIDINKEGFAEEEFAEEDKLKKKNKKELTEEEKIRLEELKEKRKNRDSAISILRAISIRMPLLVYGMDIDIKTDVTIDNFADLITDDGSNPDASWEEFMPKGVTKEIFKQFSKYYDKDIFVAASRRIRFIAKTADELEPTERVNKISSLFATFKNPDKETVLTPWKVVNMHLSDTIGGYSFYNTKTDNFIEKPILINIKDVTENIFNQNSKILEINSKTGLYPLYVTYSIYRNELNKQELEKNRELFYDEKIELWDNVIRNQIFVICKTPMAKLITKRTLLGYRNGKTNMHAFDDLIMQFKEKPEKFIEKVKKKMFWSIGGNDEMKFNAIIGNPPYQLMDGGAQSSATPIYNYFVNVAKKIEPDFISMIMPSRWMTAGKGLDEFRSQMIHDHNISILHDYINAEECFSNVEIKGGVCYFLRDNNKEEAADIYTHYSKDKIIYSKRFLAAEKDTIFIRDANLLNIKNKIWSNKLESFEKMVSTRKPYGLTGDFFKNPKKYGLPEISNYEIKDGYKIIGLGEKQKREYKYISKDYPLPKNDGLNEFKIIIPESYGAGLMGEGPSSPLIGKPGTLCTETFLQIRPVKNEIEAKNIISYMNTKLFRMLVGLIKTTQHGTKIVYSFVPIIDFSHPWNDTLLYKYFNLSDEDINYIENIIND